MTPHNGPHPWTGIALGLERLTGIRSIAYRGDIISERLQLAVKEITTGKVEVTKRWLAQLIRETQVTELFGLSDTEESLRYPLTDEWPRVRNSTANYWADQIETGVFVPEGVQMKRDKDEG